MITNLLRKFSISLVFLGLTLTMYFLISGAHVDQNGILVEKFWALGLGIIFSVFGLTAFTALSLIRILRVK